MLFRSVNLGKKGDDTLYDSYKCPDCNAEIIADDNTAATFCLYCGNTAILKNKLSGNFSPTKIISFKKTKEEAIDAFLKITKGRPLCPKEFNNKKNIDKITGIYIPFWLFDLEVNGDVIVDASKVTTWIANEKSYTKTDKFNIKRNCNMDFKLVPIDGSTRFDDNIMHSLEPFDYKELEDYNHAYLSGFFAEKYDVDSEKSLKVAEERVMNTATNQILNDIIGYSRSEERRVGKEC